MNPTIETRIHELYAELPTRERRLADLILEMQGEVAVYSATELAAQAGVSKATAARLFRRLGFADFAEMRQQARNERQPGSPLDELEGVDPQRRTLDAHLAQDLKNLTRTVEGLRSDTVADAVKILARAERLWVVGFRNNHALALYTRGLLAQLKDDVRLLPVGGYTVAEDIAAIGSGDAVLGIAFRRRLPVMTEILSAAKAADARVVLLSDPIVDDCARHAHVLLRCHNRGSALFDSYTAAISVLNLLCSGVALALGPRAKERLDRIERLHDAFGDFEP
jgi:DNA-binding MurR/RpiR family transcriptional regulator